MWIMTENGWRPLVSNAIPAPLSGCAGYRSPEEEARHQAVHARFRGMFMTNDGQNSLETGRFYRLSRAAGLSIEEAAADLH